MPMDKPRTLDDIEDLKWHVQYDTVSVFISNRRWRLLVEGTCQYLGEDDLCTRYATRPEKCRKHNPPDCEFYGAFHDTMLKTPEEVDEYFRRERERKKQARRARAPRRS